MTESIFFSKLFFQNPIVTTSGTFGYGYDFSSASSLNSLGGFTIKTLTLKPKEGNPSPRVCETEVGFINSIGLQNEGLDYFIRHIYPYLQPIKTRKIINIAGQSTEEYIKLTLALSKLKAIDLIELNVSCPNIDQKGKSFAFDKKALKEVTNECVKISKKPIIVKLSPLVTSIEEMALVCEEAGANGLSIANTFLGMKIDTDNRKPMIQKIIGGYSGVGLKPMILRMVYQVSKVCSLPILAIGGVHQGEDVVEYLLAGATLVGVGTANLIDPRASFKILKQYQRYLKKNQTTTQSLIGAMDEK